MTDSLKKSKYDFLLYLLEKGDAMVCLDARYPNVEVPKTHKNNPSLNLIFNLNFKRPIDVTEEGIFCTLAFQGRPHDCIIPFEAVWAIFTPSFKDGQVWDESIPEDVDLSAQMTHTRPSKKQPSVKAFSGRAPTGGNKENRPKKDRSHLRLIK